MCTVSYLPLTGGGYILTSNRDEAPRRNASEIHRQVIEGQTFIFPKDPESGGSWFCLSDHDRAACLLNGAYVPFTPDPKYTQSRGTALLECLRFPSLHDFTSHYDLMKTAPFTLVLVDDNILHELIWDGSTARVCEMDPEMTAFWSSVTLYPEDVRTWRRVLFQDWVAAHTGFEQDEIMHFHRYGSKEDGWNGFVMNRHERVKTLSITSVKKSGRRFTLKHSDLASGDMCIETIELISVNVTED